MIPVFNKGYEGQISYPLTQEGLNEIETVGGTVVNPVVSKSHGLAMPTYPYNKQGQVNEDFLQELFEVVHVRMLVLQDRYPTEFMAKHHPREDFDPNVLPEPLTEPFVNADLSIDNPKGLANIVHMDTPIDMPLAVLRWVRNQGVPLKTPQTGCTDFLGGVPEMIDAISLQIADSLRKAFEAKWYFGRPRPEEAIGFGSFDFTAYEEGSPSHGSFVAGHSSATSGVLPIIQHYDLSREQINVIFDTAYHWGMYRTFAGVHYATDNLAGLELAGLLERTDCGMYVQKV